MKDASCASGGVGRLIGVALLAFAWSPAAWAYQDATVVADEAPIHQFANSTSPVLSSYKRGDKIHVSDHMKKDVFGEYWYQTRIEATQGLGFIAAKQVFTEHEEDQAQASGVQKDIAHPDTEEDRGTHFLVRGMFLGTHFTGGPAVTVGGEGEFSWDFLWKEKYYLRRMLAVGGFMALSSGGQAFGGDLIFRLFTSARAEPEVRLRVGLLAPNSTANLGMGLCGGIGVPLSLDPGPHVSFFAEASGMTALSGAATLFISLGAGLGYHF
ncbi:MAG TPA: hypothetical protein VL588_08510 [Bdellovibrionota bacterium]|nr:hypothetical protein [Bdellovibrionota bacterium]